MSAVLSECGRYRYSLTRDGWMGGDGICLFIMLNPSTADAIEDDNTIRRCIGYAKDWGYGRLTVGNLFALRSTDPDGLKDVADPVGPDNDEWLLHLYDEATIAVAAWGAYPFAEQRGAEILDRFDLHCLGTSAGGRPLHPLYLSKSLVPIEYRPEARR